MAGGADRAGAVPGAVPPPLHNHGWDGAVRSNDMALGEWRKKGLCRCSYLANTDSLLLWLDNDVMHARVSHHYNLHIFEEGC